MPAMRGCNRALEARSVRVMCPAMRLCLPFFMLGAMSLTSAAVAQEQPTVISNRAEADVMSHVSRGRAARDAGRLSEAVAAFNAALATAAPTGATEALHAEILGELGLAELGLERYRDAAEHMARSLVLGASLPDFPLRRRLEAGQRTAEKHVLRLYLGVNPPDAEVILDTTKLIKRTPRWRTGSAAVTWSRPWGWSAWPRAARSAP